MMDTKIKIQIFGYRDEVISSACKNHGHRNNDGCHGCGSGDRDAESCGSCNNNDKVKNINDILKELLKSIEDSDIKDSTELEFVDLEKNSSYDYENIEGLLEQGFTTPIVVIDGVIRYYGGISFKLIYSDVKELID